MSLMTGEQYIESIRRLNLEIYMFGKRINSPVDDPHSAALSQFCAYDLRLGSDT